MDLKMDLKLIRNKFQNVIKLQHGYYDRILPGVSSK